MMSSSPLQLESYWYPRVEVQANPEYPSLLEKGLENDSESGISTEINFLKAVEDKSLYQIQLTIKALWEENPELPYRILLQAIGIFRVDEEFKHENVEHIVRINGASVLYSAAREYLLLVTSRCQWRAFALPTINFRAGQSKKYLEPERVGE